MLQTLFDASALAPVMKSMLAFGGVSLDGLAEKARDALRGAAAPGQAAIAPTDEAPPAGAPRGSELPGA